MSKAREGRSSGRRWPAWWPWLAAGLVGAGFVAAAVWFSDRGLTPRYRETVRAFYTGVAALDVGDKDRALRNLSEATQLAPEEPAAWANLALVQMQLGQFDEARQSLQQAEQLAPEAASIQVLWSALENGLGRPEAALPRLERAAELDPANVRTQFALAELLLREDPDAHRQRVSELIDRLLERYPDNLLLLLQRLELAAASSDREEVESIVDALAKRIDYWPVSAREQLAALQNALGQQQWQTDSVRELRFLRNVLKQTADFKAAVSQVVTPVKQVSEPVYEFLRLPAPPFTAAEPDTGMTFQPLESVNENPRADVLLAPGLGDNGDPVVVFANPQSVARLDSEQVLLPLPATDPPLAPSRHGLLFADWDRDYRLDLVTATAGGLRLATARPDGGFQDVTAQSGLDSELLTTAYSAAWAWDLELDGDLDLLLAPIAGPPRVLRNAGDGTFEQYDLFAQVLQPRGFRWADLDSDGDPDVALLDAEGRLHVFDNRRSGRYVARETPADLPPQTALAIGDINGDGRLDLILADAQARLIRLSTDTDRGPWMVQSLTGGSANAAPDRSAGSERPRDADLWIVDLDNNGTLDAVLGLATETRIWLNHGPEDLRELPRFQDSIRVTDVEDVTGDGRLDLLGTDPAGVPRILANQGTRDYHWQFIRPRALQKAESSDSRMNSFALSSEIQIRSGLLVQTRVVERPRVHFGLGTHERTDVARIVWPHGAAQGEFELAADAEVIAEQRLIGSCPFLFTFDGQQMRFVTDFLWRSPLGLRINAQDTAGVLQTEDWVKVDGRLLVPRDGIYDLRITADLWETHFFDHVALLVVDHPEEVEVFVDERFCFPPPPLEVLATTTPRAFGRVRDQRGNDVTEVVRKRDRNYVDSFPLGRYQGVTPEHWVEIELDSEVPADGPLVLVANGFVYPTDSSINVALAQGSAARPHGIVIEVPDGRGSWQPVSKDLGFPSGKDKTVVIDLPDAVVRGGQRRFRLRTNLEVYWDQLAWAVKRPDAELRSHRLAPTRAELLPRGVSRMRQAHRKSPELPIYDQPLPAAGYWRDLVGYYTRFGDVRELLKEVEDRYVIMNAGDELRLEFAELPPPAIGWRRDFVVIGDGWVKDGNLNTAFSRTVLPLPAHARPDYDQPPTRLEDDPVFRRYPDDWRTYHTRYVTAEDFSRGLRPAAARAGSDASRPTAATGAR